MSFLSIEPQVRLILEGRGCRRLRLSMLVLPALYMSLYTCVAPWQRLHLCLYTGTAGDTLLPAMTWTPCILTLSMARSGSRPAYFQAMPHICGYADVEPSRFHRCRHTWAADCTTSHVQRTMPVCRCKGCFLCPWSAVLHTGVGPA